MDGDVKEGSSNMVGVNSTQAAPAPTGSGVSPQFDDVMGAKHHNGVVPKEAANDVTRKPQTGVRRADDAGQRTSHGDDGKNGENRGPNGVRHSGKSRDTEQSFVQQVRFKLCTDNEAHSAVTSLSNDDANNSAGVRKKRKSKNTRTRSTDMGDACYARPTPPTPPPPPPPPPPSSSSSGNVTQIPRFHARDHQQSSLARNTDSEEDTDAKNPPRKTKVRKASAKDEEVRRLAHSMAGSIENLIGNLHGIVGDLRQLVLQIDAVTDSIDNNCRPRDVQGCRIQAAATKSSISSCTPAGDAEGRDDAALGSLRHQDGVRKHELVQTAHRLSYPQCSQHSVPAHPSSEPGETTDRSACKHSKPSKRTRYSCRASQHEDEAKSPADREKRLHSVSGEVDQIVAPAESNHQSRSVRTRRRHRIHRSSNCARGTQDKGRANSDVSNCSPDLPAGSILGEPGSALTPHTTYNPRSILDEPGSALTPHTTYNPRSILDEPGSALTPHTTYNPRSILDEPGSARTPSSPLTPATTFSSATVLTSSSSSPPPPPPRGGGAFRDEKAKDADSCCPVPDTSLNNWREMMEQHCGSAESLTPLIDWSYLALTDHHPGSTAGGFTRLADHRLDPPSPPEARSKLDPAGDVPTAAQPPQQRDWSRLALTGLKIKHKLAAISGIPEEKEPVGVSDGKGDSALGDAGPSNGSGCGKVRGACPRAFEGRSRAGAGSRARNNAGVFLYVERNAGRSAPASVAPRNDGGGLPLRVEPQLQPRSYGAGARLALTETSNGGVFPRQSGVGTGAACLSRDCTLGAFPHVEQRSSAETGVACPSRNSNASVFPLVEQQSGAGTGAVRLTRRNSNPGVFPHVQQGVGGASLGWSASNKALPDWPSGDLSSIGASDNDVDDLSSPFLPQHFHYPRRSSAVESSPELDSKADTTDAAARLSRASSASEVFPGVRSVLDSSTEQNFKEAEARMSGSSSQSDAVASSGGFEVRLDAEVSAGSDVTGSYAGPYESAMETRLEQLSTEADGSDFSDADADAGSDVLEQSLTSLETSSAKYDRDVNTWKSYTMTHIDSDDVVSDCTSDILNENFIDTTTTNPGFDDVNLNFDDVNFPSLAY